MLRCLFGAIFVGALSASVSTGSATPVFEPASCGFYVPPDEQATCGFVLVPERRPPVGEAVAAEPVIRLFVAVLHSDAEAPARDPILWLGGGPGRTVFADDAAEAWWSETSLLRERRDVLLFDARGVGRSMPALDCPEIEAAAMVPAGDTIGISPRLEREVAAALACRDRLTDAGVDLQAFTPVESTADVIDLLNAFAIDRVNLIGVSYGSRVALRLIDHMPGRVRTAVLDGAFPPGVSDLVERPRIIAEMFELLFEDCRLDWRCRQRFPYLERRFLALIDGLTAAPATLLRWSATGQEEVSVTADQVIGALVAAASDLDVVRFLPLAIERAEANDFGLLAAWLGTATATSPGTSEALALTVECSEVWPFSNTSELGRNIAEHEPYGRSARHHIAWQVCPDWPVDPVPEAFNTPIMAETPVLLLTGSYDPITPPDWSYRAAESLRAGRVLEFAFGSHGTLATVPCAIRATAAFIDNPATDVRSLCRDRTRSPRFVTQAR